MKLLGIDIMGGDFAPREAVLGAMLALDSLPLDTRLLLIGDSATAHSIITDHGGDVSRFDYHHTTQVITMAENATRAFQQKPDSSIAAGFQLLADKRIHAFASAGNTGAMMVGAMLTVKNIPGLLRPAISSVLPKEDGSVGILLDVGINADCKPEMLVQFGILGSELARHVYSIANPRVGLMNLGEEEEKGNLLAKETHQLLKQSADLNFIGNVEGRDLFNDMADVIVCDGFTGNVILKQAESFYSLVQKRNVKDEYFERFNYENYGGTPILGINGNAIIAHGISKATAIKNMIMLASEVADANLCEKIKHVLSHSVPQ